MVETRILSPARFRETGGTLLFFFFQFVSFRFRPLGRRRQRCLGKGKLTRSVLFNKKRKKSEGTKYGPDGWSSIRGKGKRRINATGKGDDDGHQQAVRTRNTEQTTAAPLSLSLSRSSVLSPIPLATKCAPALPTFTEEPTTWVLATTTHGQVKGPEPKPIHDGYLRVGATHPHEQGRPKPRQAQSTPPTDNSKGGPDQSDTKAPESASLQAAEPQPTAVLRSGAAQSTCSWRGGAMGSGQGRCQGRREQKNNGEADRHQRRAPTTSGHKPGTYWVRATILGNGFLIGINARPLGWFFFSMDLCEARSCYE